MNFDRFVHEIIENNWAVFGAEVYENGQCIAEYGDVQTHRHPIYSATKSITSIAVGMARDEGKIDIDKSVLYYLPGSFEKGMNARQREAYRYISVKRLLSMSVDGYPFRPESDCWLREALDFPLVNTEQPVFHYSNFSAYLAGVAASEALNEDLYQYLTRKLFMPLKIVSPPFERCPNGYFYGASKMELTVRELSAIGLMLVNGGVWNGERLLSTEYIKEASSVQQMNREGGYGYFFWKYRDGFSINGKWGQKCYILPVEKRVITFLSHMEENEEATVTSMEKHILGLSV